MLKDNSSFNVNRQADILLLNCRMLKQSTFILFFSVLFCNSALLVSCKADKKLHYVVETPENWTRKDGRTAEGWKKSTFTPSSGDTAYLSGENIIIAGVPFNNLDEYVHTVYANVRKTAAVYHEEKREKLKIKGLEARYIQLELSFPANPDIMVEQKTYFIKDGAMIFMIVCTARENKIEHLQKVMDEILASFKTEEDK